MSPLASIIASEIAAGPVTFRRFMELALYHPQHGYYAAGKARIGRGGDFFTNVSVGPLFGRLLARQFADMWQRLGRPADFTIVEQGAHHGQFAADALCGLREFAPECFAAVRYVIVEPLIAMRDMQRDRLMAHLPSSGSRGKAAPPEFAAKATWRDSLAEVEPWTGVHFSNELPDAFPVHRVVHTGGQWREQHVAFLGERFEFEPGPLSTPALASACEKFAPPVQPGFTTEINLAAAEWIREVAARLVRGWVLAVDYGYTRDQMRARPGGTLSAYAGHRRVDDALANPGEADLTAHVEFTSLTEAATETGLEPAGFTDQHRFMAALGALHFTGPPEPYELRAFRTLMHPELLGSVFKVIAFRKGTPAGLAGFTLQAQP